MAGVPAALAARNKQVELTGAKALVGGFGTYTYRAPGQSLEYFYIVPIVDESFDVFRDPGMFLVC